MQEEVVRPGRGCGVHAHVEHDCHKGGEVDCGHEVDGFAAEEFVLGIQSESIQRAVSWLLNCVWVSMWRG